VGQTYQKLMAARPLTINQTKPDGVTPNRVPTCAEGPKGMVLVEQIRHKAQHPSENLLPSAAQVSPTEPGLVTTSTVSQLQQSLYGGRGFLSIPNPKPEHVSDRVHNIICKSAFIQTVLYGVQEPQVGPSAWERVRGIFMSMKSSKQAGKGEESDKTTSDAKNKEAEEMEVRTQVTVLSKGKDAPTFRNKSRLVELSGSTEVAGSMVLQ
jgi:hypothetical protein